MCNLWYFSWRRSFTVNVPEPNKYIWKKMSARILFTFTVSKGFGHSTEVQNTIIMHTSPRAKP